MDTLQRMFGSLTKDLAPGISDPGKVVGDRILYSSAKEDGLNIPMDKSAKKPAPEKSKPLAIPDKTDDDKGQYVFELPGFGKDDMAVEPAPGKPAADEKGMAVEHDSFENDLSDLMTI